MSSWSEDNRQPQASGVTPDFEEFRNEGRRGAVDKIYRVVPKDLNVLFDRKNKKEPVNQGEVRPSLQLLKECGYHDGLCQLLDTHPVTGITGDEADLKRRVKLFGQNQFPLPTVTGFLELLASQFEDAGYRALIVAGTLYTVFAFCWVDDEAIEHPPPRKPESLTIFGGTFFAALVCALADWTKESQFLKIREEIDKERVVVFRGQNPTEREIPSRGLVVGDVIDVQQGDIVPADCILIEEMNIHVDESMYDSRAVDVEKEPSDAYDEVDVDKETGVERWDNHHDNPDPILLTGSKVLAGSGRAVVCAVGTNTRLSRSRGAGELKLREQQTYFEERLAQAAEQITKYAVGALVLLVLLQLIRLVVDWLISPDSTDVLERCIRTAIIGICVYIVAVPEGLPLAISISMALSIGNLKEDEVLIKTLQAVQNCGLLHDICVGKTGTLTKGKGMRVAKYHLYGRDGCLPPDDDRAQAYFTDRLAMRRACRDLLIDSILGNTNAWLSDGFKAEDGVGPRYEVKGQELEVALLNFLVENGSDLHRLIAERNKRAKVEFHVPWDQNHKVKIIGRRDPNNDQVLNVYVKGCPEYVIQTCTHSFVDSLPEAAGSQRRPDFGSAADDERKRYYANLRERTGLEAREYAAGTIDYEWDQTGTGQSKALVRMRADHHELLTQRVSADMAQKGLKTIAYAYRQMTAEEFDEIMEQVGDRESQEFRAAIQKDMGYIGTFGLEDPLNDGVEDAIKLIKYGTKSQEEIDKSKGSHKNTVNIRMVTGDHLATAVKVAVDCKIIDAKQAEDASVAMTGAVFRNAVGGYREEWNAEKQAYDIIFDNEKVAHQVKKKLRVIARATADDKKLLVAAIVNEGGMVLMSGKGIADGPALRMASVGICMGGGCAVAKENSDLVILDDKFQSIYSALMWGRTIFHNVRKFMQFQLTVNISLLSTILISAAFCGRPPFTVLELLWCNLVMDILGSIALCTEPYVEGKAGLGGDPKDAKDGDKDDQGTRRRISRKDPLIDHVMWRNIVCQSTYQLLVMLVLIFAGPYMYYDEPYNPLYAADLGMSPTEAKNRRQNNTFVFNTFMFMSYMNMINSRSVREKDPNVLKNAHKHLLFWLMLAIMILLHGAMLQGGPALQMEMPEPAQWWTSLGCAAFTLVLGVITKFIPKKHFERITLDLETVSDTDNFVTRTMKTVGDKFEERKAQVTAGLKDKTGAGGGRFQDAAQMSGDFGAHFVPPPRQHSAGVVKGTSGFDDAYTGDLSRIKKKQRPDGDQDANRRDSSQAAEIPQYSNHDRPEEDTGQQIATHNVAAEQAQVDDDNYQNYAVNESEVPEPTGLINAEAIEPPADDHYGNAGLGLGMPQEDEEVQPLDQPDYGTGQDDYGPPPDDQVEAEDDANPYGEGPPPDDEKPPSGGGSDQGDGKKKEEGGSDGDGSGWEN